MFQNIGEMVVLFWRTLLALPLTLRHRQKVYDQLFEIGNASLLMKRARCSSNVACAAPAAAWSGFPSAKSWPPS